MGGGAAGYFAAIAAAENHPRAQVTLLEATRHPLSKVRVSGGGRCNVTHACFEPAAFVQNYPRGSKALRGAMARFQAQDTVNWFRDRGVVLKTEPDGRMFPTTDSSETIIDCLTRFAYEAGVIVRTSAAVESVAKTAGFELTLKSGEVLKCDRLLLATGSSAIGHRLAQSLGHSIEPPVPSLFTFNILDSQLRELAGVAVESVQAKLLIPNQKPLEQTGPLLVTHWGLSGPAILKLSAWGARSLHDQHYQATLQINWLPECNLEKLRQELLTVKAQLSRRSIFANCPVMLPRRLWQFFISKLEIAPETRWADFSKKQLNQLIELLTQSRYEIQGKGVFKEEFVTCGGVLLKEVDFRTMESRCCPGLFFAGEILDIDGITGGFNFQSAWTTGWIAGQAIATRELAIAASSANS